ncbi:hypothetical protein D3C78_1375110 [compost metagenome]
MLAPMIQYFSNVTRGMTGEVKANQGIPVYGKLSILPFINSKLQRGAPLIQNGVPDVRMRKQQCRIEIRAIIRIPHYTID